MNGHIIMWGMVVLGWVIFLFPFIVAIYGYVQDRRFAAEEAKIHQEYEDMAKGKGKGGGKKC